MILFRWRARCCQATADASTPPFLRLTARTRLEAQLGAVAIERLPRALVVRVPLELHDDLAELVELALVRGLVIPTLREIASPLLAILLGGLLLRLAAPVPLLHFFPLLLIERECNKSLAFSTRKARNSATAIPMNSTRMVIGITNAHFSGCVPKSS